MDHMPYIVAVPSAHRNGNSNLFRKFLVCMFLLSLVAFVSCVQQPATDQQNTTFSSNSHSSNSTMPRRPAVIAAHVDRLLLEWYNSQMNLTATVGTSARNNMGSDEPVATDVHADSTASDGELDESTSGEAIEKPAKKLKQKNKQKNKQGGKGRKNRNKNSSLVNVSSDNSTSSRLAIVGTDNHTAQTDNTNETTTEMTFYRINQIEYTSPSLSASNTGSTRQFTQPPTISSEVVIDTNSSDVNTLVVTNTSSGTRNPSSITATEAPSQENTTLNSSLSNPMMTSEPQSSSGHTLIVLLVLAIVCIVVAMMIYWYRERRRQLEQLRLQLLPVYNYDPAEEQDDWENRLLGESTGLKPRDKVPLYGQLSP